MKNFAEFLASKNLTEANLNEKSAEEQAGLYKEYNELKDAELAAALESKATKEEIEAIKSEISENFKKQFNVLEAAFKSQGIMLKKLTSKDVEAGKTGFLGTLKSALAENLDSLKAMKEKNSRGFQVKVAGDMTLSGNVSGGDVPQAQRLAGLDTVPSRRIRLMDIVTRGMASSNLIEWVSQANKDGAAGQTAEGAVKNQIDFDLVVDSEKIKKTTAFIKVSTEMLDDVDFIQSEINNELVREVLKAVESGIYGGDGTGENLNGIRTVASAFAAGAFAASVDNANFVDVLRVAMDQIKVAEHDGANYILAHPSDVTALKLIKTSTTDKRYIDALQLIAGQMTVDGVPVIETTLVTQGEYLVGDFSRAFVYDKGEMNITVGLDSDDFTKNFRTILAEWRGAAVVKTNDRTAFVKGVIATDAAALETAP